MRICPSAFYCEEQDGIFQQGGRDRDEVVLRKSGESVGCKEAQALAVDGQVVDGERVK